MSSTHSPDKGGSAFPVSNGQGFIPSSGMSLRDWFAGMAMQGMNASESWADNTHDSIANAAYDQADAMLAARKEAQP